MRISSTGVMSIVFIALFALVFVTYNKNIFYDVIELDELERRDLIFEVPVDSLVEFNFRVLGEGYASLEFYDNSSYVAYGNEYFSSVELNYTGNEMTSNNIYLDADEYKVTVINRNTEPTQLRLKIAYLTSIGNEYGLLVAITQLLLIITIRRDIRNRRATRKLKEICNKCNDEYEVDDIFCGKCGAKLR